MGVEPKTSRRCIVLAGGGTGGHLVPGLAVAEELRRNLPDARVVFIGTKRPVEEHMVPRAGFELRTVDAPRTPERVWQWPAYPFRLMASISRAKAALRELSPGVVVGLGGYGSVPVVLAAKKLGVPIALMEQNSVPGKANRLLSRWALEVYAQFESSRARFRNPDRVLLLGNPLRDSITKGSRERAAKRFSLEPGRRTLLILGGSQGARTVNESVSLALGEFEQAGPVQIIHQTGSLDFDRVQGRYKASGIRSHVVAFLDDMPEALAAADLVISRAGATTLAEIAACGKPSVLVPYPFAAEDHQRLNAEVYEKAGAAVMIRNAEFTPVEAGRVVKEMLFDEIRLRRMGDAAKTLAKLDATRDVCHHLLVILERAGS